MIMYWNDILDTMSNLIVLNDGIMGDEEIFIITIRAAT